MKHIILSFSGSNPYPEISSTTLTNLADIFVDSTLIDFSFFSTLPSISAFIRTSFHSHKVYIVSLYSNQQAVLSFPLVVKRNVVTTACFLGHHLFDYFPVRYSPSLTLFPYLAEFWRALSSLLSIHFYSFKGVPSSFLYLFPRSFTFLYTYTFGTCISSDLSALGFKPTANISTRYKSDLNRQLKRLTSAETLSTKITTPLDSDWTQRVSSLINLKFAQLSRGASSNSSLDTLLSWLINISPQNHATPIIFSLDTPCKALASVVCLIESNTLYYMMPVYDPSYSYFSPGALLLLHISDYCIVHNLSLDLLTGESSYKYRWASSRESIHRCILFPSF